jgi:hypothetical protein
MGAIAYKFLQRFTNFEFLSESKTGTPFLVSLGKYKLSDFSKTLGSAVKLLTKLVTEFLIY